MKLLRHLLVLSLFSLTPSFGDSPIVARAGAFEIKADEVRDSLETLDALQLASLRQNPELLEQVVRSFVVQRLVLGQAMAQKWNEKPEVVARLRRAHDSALTESYLEFVSRPPAHYPDEAELTRAYESRKASLLVPRGFRLMQVFVPVTPGADAKVRKQALADAESALRRGDLTEIGWLTEQQVQPEIRAHLPDLKPQAVSAPVALNDGWHIFKVVDVRDARTPGLDEVRAQLRLALRQERQRENTQAWLAAFLKDNPLKLEPAALSRTLLPNSPTPSAP